MWVQRATSLFHFEKFRKCSKPPLPFMFCSFYGDIPQKKSKPSPLQERRMIDRFRMYAKGGDGGSGCQSIRRSRQDRQGRSDGGNGGRGGDVILECSPDVWDFSGVQHHIKAQRGGNGASKNMIGTRGQDKIIQVPVGTVIHLINGELPSAVEIVSSSNLDPWDMPGTVVSNMTEADQILEPVDIATAEAAKHVQNHNTKLTHVPGISSANQTIQAARDNAGSQVLSIRPPKRNEKEIYHDGEECRNKWKNIRCSENATDSEQIEELEMEEEIQYNAAELTEQGQRLTIACGGDGGLGSVCIPRLPVKPCTKKSNVNDFQEVDDDESSLSAGHRGSEIVLLLELKSIADVGLVGIPNAGKSTLLGALSRARPTIGSYAFTTLRPNLGNLKYDDISMTVADIPGLIKGAHENRGLGHAFLRHIERTKVLAYVLDLSSGLNGNKGIPPWEQLRDLVLELQFYSEELSDRPSLVVANKIDEPGAEEVYEELKRRIKGVSIYPVCAVLEEGVPELRAGLRMIVNGEQSSSLSLDRIEMD